MGPLGTKITKKLVDAIANLHYNTYAEKMSGGKEDVFRVTITNRLTESETVLTLSEPGL